MMVFRQPEARERYVSLDRAAEVLSLSDSQLTQYLITGQMLAAVIYHKPSDYRDTKEITLGDGREETHTRSNRTMFKFVSPDHKYHEVMYLHPEDAGRVLLNKVTNREILIGRLFYGPELEPKKGLALPGDSSVGVEKEELVIPSEELARFAKKAKIKFKRQSEKELNIPPKSWYDRPLGRTILAVAAIVIASVFLMKVKGEL